MGRALERSAGTEGGAPPLVGLAVLVWACHDSGVVRSRGRVDPGGRRVTGALSGRGGRLVVVFSPVVTILLKGWSLHQTRGGSVGGLSVALGGLCGRGGVNEYGGPMCPIELVQGNHAIRGAAAVRAAATPMTRSWPSSPRTRQRHRCHTPIAGRCDPHGSSGPVAS